MAAKIEEEKRRPKQRSKGQRCVYQRGIFVAFSRGHSNGFPNDPPTKLPLILNFMWDGQKFGYCPYYQTSSYYPKFAPGARTVTAEHSSLRLALNNRIHFPQPTLESPPMEKSHFTVSMAILEIKFFNTSSLYFYRYHSRNPTIAISHIHNSMPCPCQ